MRGERRREARVAEARGWRRRARRKRRDGRAFVDAAEGRAEHLLSGATVGLVAHERVDETDNREARAGSGVTDRGPATISVPAEDLAGETQAAHSVPARNKLHAAGRQLKNVRTAGRV